MFKKKLAILIASLICMSAISYTSVSAMEDDYDEQGNIDNNFPEPHDVDTAYKMRYIDFTILNIMSGTCKDFLTKIQKGEEYDFADSRAEVSNFDEFLEKYFRILNQFNKCLLVTFEDNNILENGNDNTNEFKKTGIREQHIKSRKEFIESTNRYLNNIFEVLKDKKYELDANTKKILDEENKNYIEIVKQCNKKIKELSENKNINIDQDKTYVNTIATRLIDTLRNMINNLNNDQDINKKIYCVTKLSYDDKIGQILEKIREMKYIIDMEQEITNILNTNNITDKEKAKNIEKAIEDKAKEFSYDGHNEKMQEEFEKDFRNKVPVTYRKITDQIPEKNDKLISYKDIMKQMPNKINNPIYFSTNLMQGVNNNRMMQQQPAVNNLQELFNLFRQFLLFYNMYQQSELNGNNGMQNTQNQNNDNMSNINVETESEEEAIERIKETLRKYLLEDKKRINEFKNIEEFLADSPEYNGVLNIIKRELDKSQEKIEEDITKIKHYKNIKKAGYKNYKSNEYNRALDDDIDEAIEDNENGLFINIGNDYDMLEKGLDENDEDYENESLNTSEKYKENIDKKYEKIRNKMKKDLEQYKKYAKIYTKVLEGDKPKNILELFEQVSKKARQNIEGLNDEKYKNFVDKIYGIRGDSDREQRINNIKRTIKDAETDMKE